MTYNQQIENRLDRAYTNCPILINSDQLEELLRKAYNAVWVYSEYHRAESILDGLYQRFGYPELSPQ